MAPQKFVLTIVSALFLVHCASSPRPSPELKEAVYLNSQRVPNENKAVGAKDEGDDEISNNDDRVTPVYPLFQGSHRVNVATDTNHNNLVGVYDNATAAPVADFIRRAQKTVDIEIYENF